MNTMISPCILVCSLDTETGYCFGCGRTGKEIADWTGYTDAQRQMVMSTLPARLSALAVPPAPAVEPASALERQSR